MNEVQAIAYVLEKHLKSGEEVGEAHFILAERLYYLDDRKEYKNLINKVKDLWWAAVDNEALRDFDNCNEENFWDLLQKRSHNLKVVIHENSLVIVSDYTNDSVTIGRDICPPTNGLKDILLASGISAMYYHEYVEENNE